VTFLGDAPSASPDSFGGSEPTIYYSSGNQGWGDTFAGLAAEAISSE
jgi:hypothetical protein